MFDHYVCAGAFKFLFYYFHNFFLARCVRKKENNETRQVIFVQEQVQKLPAPISHLQTTKNHPSFIFLIEFNAFYQNDKILAKSSNLCWNLGGHKIS